MDSFAKRVNEALNADRPTLLMFYDKNDERAMRELAVARDAGYRLNDQANIIEIDVNAEPELAAKYHVRNVPAFILFSDGQEAWRTVGSIAYAEIKDMVKRFE